MTEAAAGPTMRAAVIDGPAQLTVREIARPAPGPDEVLVQIDYCGVCGTDLHNVLEGWAPAGSVSGHEWSGRVAEIGSQITQWAVGDLVVGGPPWCRRCEWCLAGRPALCETDAVRTGALGHRGAFADFHLATGASLHRVPAGLDLRTAALSEPLAVALHAVTTAGRLPHVAQTRTLVSGAGPLGLLVVAALGASGISGITVAEPSTARRAQALLAGATLAVSPEELPGVPELPTQCSAEGFDLAFETSGKGAAIGTALGLLRPAGRLVLLGTGSMSARMDPIRILFNELVVTGAYCYDESGIDDALALLASGTLPVDALVSAHDVTLAGLLDTMLLLRSGELPTKALVRP
jgi:2-desacetyl-2-hydroxyethyl bacteriochlorophyllide A dehydrogenase